jgi:hypothetical protein
MIGTRTRAIILSAVLGTVLAFPALSAQEVKVDLGKETVGKTPQLFEPMMGTWIVAQDGPDKVIKVDGSQYKASLDTPSRLLIENARKLYGTSNEELLDNAKQFTNYPVAVLKTVENFTNGSISVKFKTITGEADRCSGILFNVKPNGDWLALRYNDTEHNVILWEFHNGVRRPLIAPRDGTLLATPEDRNTWHELRLDVAGAIITATLDGTKLWDYMLGSAGPAGGRGRRAGAPGAAGAAAATPATPPPPPDTSHDPDNNPVIRPPVMGKVGLWSKTDSVSEFKDYVVIKK